MGDPRYLERESGERLWLLICSQDRKLTVRTEELADDSFGLCFVFEDGGVRHCLIGFSIAGQV